MGYTTSREIGLGTASAPGWFIGNAAFEGVGEDGLVAIKDLLTTTLAAVESGEDNCAEIQVLTASGQGYTSYYYISDAEDEDTGDYPVTAWANGNDYVAKNKIAIGTAFWYKTSGESSTITSPGQVANASTVTRDVDLQWKLLGNGWPIGLDLQKVTTTVPALESGEDDVLELQVLTASGQGYTSFYYISDAEDEDSGDYPVTAWANGSDYVAKGEKVAAGAGMWVKNNTLSGTITFEK